MIVRERTTAALDPLLLSTSFKVRTQWHVLTGAACTGKTTLINLLAGKGFRVVQESARQYFEAQLVRGKTIAQIRRDDPALQRKIAAIQLRLESGLEAAGTCFLDRGFPDSLAFFRIFGMDPNAILPECFIHRYAGVFLLDRLPLQRNLTMGPEDAASSDFLDAWLERDYRSLGYEVIRVPVLPPEERLAFILERISSKGRGNPH